MSTLLSVETCLRERQKYDLRDVRTDAWVEMINESRRKKDVFFVTGEHFLSSATTEQRNILLERYHLAGLFGLSAPYRNTFARMVLVHLTTDAVSDVRIAEYTGPAYQPEMRNVDWKEEFELPEKYEPQFTEYLETIETWVNDAKTEEPEEGILCHFNTVSADTLDEKNLHPSYYTRRAVRLRERALDKSRAKLSDVADLLFPKKGKESEEPGKILRPADCSYPLDVEALPEDTPTTVLLQKGDILFPTVPSRGCYLFDLEPNEKKPVNVYASTTEVVIRCRDILPEYLYLYLNSNVAFQLFDILGHGAAVRHLSTQDLKDLPIARQTESDEKYIEDFRVLSTMAAPKKRQLEGLRGYYSRLQSRAQNRPQEQQPIAEPVLDPDLANDVKVCQKDPMQAVLKNDIAELNVCFAGGAYKATLFLAGGILEAVLLDWLSERDGKNYFSAAYRVKEEEAEEERDAVLTDYIAAIEELKLPGWMEVGKAGKGKQKQKQKQDPVYTKLCLKKSYSVCEETCRGVIGYLEEVLLMRDANENTKNKN